MSAPAVEFDPFDLDGPQMFCHRFLETFLGAVAVDPHRAAWALMDENLRVALIQTWLPAGNRRRSVRRNAATWVDGAPGLDLWWPRFVSAVLSKMRAAFADAISVPNLVSTHRPRSARLRPREGRHG
jgi:hypothetical protein